MRDLRTYAVFRIHVPDHVLVITYTVGMGMMLTIYAIDTYFAFIHLNFLLG